MSSTSGWRVIREHSGNGRLLWDGNHSLSPPGSWWSAEKVTLRTNEYGPEAGSLGRCPRGSGSTLTHNARRFPVPTRRPASHFVRRLYAHLGSGGFPRIHLAARG